MKRLSTTLAAAAFAVAGSAGAMAEKWDMPMAYSGSNFHSATGAEFAKCVTTGTGGDIVTHPSGSLFKGNDIKRAVQTGQAPIGERLLSAHQNENAVFAFDSIPFLATSFGDADKLWQAAKPTLEKGPGGAKSGPALFRSLAAARTLLQKGGHFDCRHEGCQVSLLQQRDRQAC